MEGVSYCGYTQEVRLEIRSGGGISAEAWNVTQVAPPGDVLLPTTGAADTVDYYVPADKAHLQKNQTYARLKATGERRYKVGFRSAQVRGDLVYFGTIRGGAAYLYVKRFFNNPSAEYAEESAGQPGENGFSIHVYNDDGKLGGVAELECNLLPIGGRSGRIESRDVVCNWFFYRPAGTTQNNRSLVVGNNEARITDGAVCSSKTICATLPTHTAAFGARPHSE